MPQKSGEALGSSTRTPNYVEHLSFDCLSWSWAFILLTVETQVVGTRDYRIRPPDICLYSFPT